MTAVADHVSWPASWRTVPLWSLFRRIKDVGHPHEEMLSVYRDHGVIRKDSRSDNFNKTAENRDIYQLVDVGWLIVNRMKAWQGSLGVSPYRGIVSGHYLCLRPEHAEEPRFLNYLLRSAAYTVELQRLSRGVRPNQIEIDNDGLRALPVRLPTLQEQRAIVDRLDTETVRIDALIAKKGRLLAMVDEHLDANSEHIVWDDVAQTIPLMHLTEAGRPIMYGIVLPGPDVPQGISIVKGGDVAANRLHSSRLCRTTAEIEAPYARARLRAADLVFAIRGGIGDVAVVPPDIEGANITQDVARIAPAPDVDPLWLMTVLRTRSVRTQVQQRATGATVRGLNIWDLKRIRVPWSGIDRQRRDLEALLPVIERRDAVSSRLRCQIDLLREHKQALITAAVTGEMEVPGVAA